MPLKIDGLDKLTRRLEDVCRSFQALEEEIARYSIVPGDPASVQAALRQMEAALDRTAAGYGPLVEQFKGRYREYILRRARG